MKTKTRWIIALGLLFCFTILSFTACSPTKQVHKHPIVTGKDLGKEQTARLAVTEQVKIKNKKEIIFRVFTVDGKKISTEVEDIVLPSGRHTISCYISHYREYNAAEWMQPKKKKLFHLEFNAVKGRQYKPT